MVKKFIQIFSFAAFLFLCIFFANAAEVRIELKNVDLVKGANGKAVPTVRLDQSFDVDIIIKDPGKNLSNITLQGLDAVNFVNQSQTSSIQSVNGSSLTENIYHITVQARKEGLITLGPAQIKVDGKTISSNTVSIDVRKNYTQQAGAQGQMRTGQPSVLCKLSADKQTVVVGEPIVVTLSVYVHGPILGMGLGNVSFDRFLVKEFKEKAERNEVVDGISYRVQEIKYILTPLQEGIREIAPITVQYLVQPQKRSTRHGLLDFGALEAFFGEQGEQRQAVSNDLKITVSSLPEHKGLVHGIGDFSSFTASINKQNADLNEPLTLTLSIQGKGNFEQIAIPKASLPKWFKSYESKTEIDQSPNGGTKKFNFIVQASKAGKVQIPSQSFTYFDVVTRTYKTLKTAPIDLEISTPEDYQPMPEATIVLNEPSQSKQEILSKQETQTVTPSFLTSVGNISLPWWLFVILLFLPLLLFSKKISNMIKPVIAKLFGRWIYTRKLVHFDKALQAMQSKGDAGNLHQFFLTFLATKNKINVDMVTEDWIEQWLRQSGWTPEKIDEFLEFLSTCACLRFMQSQALSVDQKALLKKSKYWLIMLNK